MDIAKSHQMKIARSTLKMSIAGARIMGGMDHCTAYELVFRAPLIDRLNHLVAEYGEKAALDFDNGGVNWEMGRYGWTPAALLAALR